MKNHPQLITYVVPGSPADYAGILSGDVLLSINGEPVLDLIDYEHLTACRTLHVTVRRGELERSFRIRKSSSDSLGLDFETSLMSRMQTCRNRCMFCFVDQMPRGVRTSLHVKDDDWRMSFIMGNYVTLTNVSDAEFERILKRGVSPLYVSVHATDPEARIRIMKNPSAGRIMERLSALKEAGIRFHTQVVLCPGINDGAVLEGTVCDLASLIPACASMAVVPVGLTRYREGLEQIDPYDQNGSRAVIDQISRHQEQFLAEYGTRFVFLSDEWYLNAQLPIPEEEHYEDYSQLENGVGMLRLFASEFESALKEREPLKERRGFSIAGGTAAHSFFRDLYRPLESYGIDLDLYAVPNRFFGGNVHVAGLVTGQDLVYELSDKRLKDTLLIPGNMLREREDVFLDGMTVRDLEKALTVSVRTFTDGWDLVRLLFEVGNE